jgi:hypothetical protein
MIRTILYVDIRESYDVFKLVFAKVIDLEISIRSIVFLEAQTSLF